MVSAAAFLMPVASSAAPQVVVPGVGLRHVADTKLAWASPVRIARNVMDPSQLYVLRINGDLLGVNPISGSTSLLYSAADHGVANPQGMAIGPDGTIYLVGNEDRPNQTTRATIMKGRGSGASRTWSVLAQTVDYPRSNTAFDHRFNGVLVSLDNRSIYVASGSRTDHGEVQSAGGLYPATREVGLTAVILKLPTNAQNLLLVNDRAALKGAGYVFVEGVRNTFDMAYGPRGELFGTDNGPDRDMSEELNWLRPGRHYGFPWRIGGSDNPQQYPNYDPSQDVLLDSRFVAVFSGFYQNDPTFPSSANLVFTEPLRNIGPDADKFRSPLDGQIKDASDLRVPFSTFTAHRSPLGLSFDRQNALTGSYRGAGFVLGWTAGDPTGNSVAGPFFDSSQDVLRLKLRKRKNDYELSAQQIAAGFANPIDSELVGNKLYVLEYGGAGGLWELTLPGKTPRR